MNPPLEEVTEQHIADLVKLFYQRAANDSRLQAVFDAAISDWDAHHRIVQDFWSKTLLRTERYHGSPYPLHARLPLKLEQFDVWLAHFRQTAGETLPPQAAQSAIARAEQMAESFKLGMFLDYFPGNGHRHG